MNPHHPTSLAEYYFGFLQNLNADSKLDLIVKLSESLKQVGQGPETSLQALFGAYRTEQTADEIIAEIRASRVSNRRLESL